MYTPNEDFYNLGAIARRLAELCGKHDAGRCSDSEQDEYEALCQLSRDVPDWGCERPLIAEHYFSGFAREEAESVHGTDMAGWPFDHLDWQAAAAELKTDYTRVLFAGKEYWIRRYSYSEVP